MSTCVSCSAQLQPVWKFCIFCGTPAVPGAIRPEAVEGRRVNALAVLALILACLGGAPALIFGHLAMRQIRTTGDRGLPIARVATVLGYLWLVVWIVALVNLLF
jgi:hypothetical protein